MLRFKLTKYGDYMLSSLLRTYARAVDGGLTWKQSLNVAYIQVAIVVNDFFPLIAFGALLVGASSFGIYISFAYGGFEIWLGIISFLFSVAFGAFGAVAVSERFVLPIFTRYGLWFLLVIAINSTLYYSLPESVVWEPVWLVATFPTVLAILGSTYLFYKDTMSFAFYIENTKRVNLADKIPFRVRAPIIRMAAEDKYVWIKTEKGECELRITLSDAIAAVNASGVQVHRSHWVRNDYINTLEKEGRSFYLHVCDNKVPVSAKKVDVVKRIVEQNRLNVHDPLALLRSDAQLRDGQRQFRDFYGKNAPERIS